MMFNAWKWFDNRWWKDGYQEPIVEIDGLNGGIEFLDQTPLFLKLNCALAAGTVLINEAVALKREAFNNPDPAFFKWVAKS